MTNDKNEVCKNCGHHKIEHTKVWREWRLNDAEHDTVEIVHDKACFSCDCLEFEPQDNHNSEGVRSQGDKNVSPKEVINEKLRIRRPSESPTGDKTPSDVIEFYAELLKEKNEEIKQARAEALKDEAKFLEWLYSVIGDEDIDWMLEINRRILKLKQKLEGEA